MIEKELKYLLRSEDYIKIKNYFDMNWTYEKEIINTNYYFDSDDWFFYNNNITIRLRNINDFINEFTIKIPLQYSKNNKSLKDEITVKVSDKQVNYILKNPIIINDLIEFINIPADKIEKYKLKCIKAVGKLSTVRSYYKINNNFGSINLDLSQYGDNTDFEIEWEVDNLEDANDFLMNIFKKLDVLIISNNQSKYVRFMNTMINKNCGD